MYATIRTRENGIAGCGQSPAAAHIQVDCEVAARESSMVTTPKKETQLMTRDLFLVVTALTMLAQAGDEEGPLQSSGPVAGKAIVNPFFAFDNGAARQSSVVGPFESLGC